MEKLNFINKRIVILCGILFAVGIITCLTPVSITRLHHLSAFSYLTIILIWTVSIQRRIIDAKIRHRMLAACVSMVLLFFLRMCKYSYFPEDVMINEYIWYAYSIPLTLIPLFFFMSSLRVEPVGNEKAVGVAEALLLLLNAAMALVVMTNAFHGQVYQITVHPDKEYTHAWFYYVVYFWRFFLSFATLYVFMKKCSLSAAKKKWYIPAICLLASCILLIWYHINGGPPRVYGRKLFQLHEALCMPYILTFESFIQIGMVAANSGYRQLFDHSGLSACIYGNDGSTVLAAKNWTETGQDEDHRLCREDISGGYVTWVEDISELNRINREIEEVTEELTDENELMRQEKEAREERVSFEIRNRMYNRMASAIRTRAVRVNELLERASSEEGEEKDSDIKNALVLSVYIKRMGNLILMADGKDILPAEELNMAVGESVEYLRLKGCVCELTGETACGLSSQLAMLAYELFQEAVEAVWLRLHTIIVSMEVSDHFEMSITMDAAAEAITSTWRDRELRDAGGRLSVRYEDETYYITLISSCTTASDKAVYPGSGLQPSDRTTGGYV